MSSEPPRQRLPFEPTKSRKKATKNPSPAPAPAHEDSSAPAPAKDRSTAPQKLSKNKKSQRPNRSAEQSIPEVVSQRMVGRMVMFSGVPLLMALSIFVGSYFIVVNEILVLPNTAVLLTSLGCFGLSVVGLSYGLFSASWDEELTGSRLGWSEFKLNVGRAIDGWKSARQNQNSSK
ncbi:MAG: PAM68 family protein [Microcoleaceae cyanobacterium]